MVGKVGAGLVYICLNMSSELLWICLLYVNQITIKLLLTHTHRGFSWITNHTQAEGHRLAGMSEQGQPTRSWPRGSSGLLVLQGPQPVDSRGCQGLPGCVPLAASALRAFNPQIRKKKFPAKCYSKQIKPRYVYCFPKSWSVKS